MVYSISMEMPMKLLTESKKQKKKIDWDFYFAQI